MSAAIERDPTGGVMTPLVEEPSCGERGEFGKVDTANLGLCCAINCEYWPFYILVNCWTLLFLIK